MLASTTKLKTLFQHTVEVFRKYSRKPSIEIAHLKAYRKLIAMFKIEHNLKSQRSVFVFHLCYADVGRTGTTGVADLHVDREQKPHHEQSEQQGARHFV